MEKIKIKILAKIFSPRSACLRILRESGGVLAPTGQEGRRDSLISQTYPNQACILHNGHIMGVSRSCPIICHLHNNNMDIMGPYYSYYETILWAPLWAPLWDFGRVLALCL